MWSWEFWFLVLLIRVWFMEGNAYSEKKVNSIRSPLSMKERNREKKAN